MVARHGFHSARNESRDNGNSKKKITEATPVSPEQSDQNTAWYDSLETDPEVEHLYGPRSIKFSDTIKRVDGWNDDDLHKANYEEAYQKYRNTKDLSDAEKEALVKKHKTSRVLGRRNGGAAHYIDIDPKWAVIHHTANDRSADHDGSRYAKKWLDTGKGVHFLVSPDGTIHQIQSIHKQGVHTGQVNTEFGKDQGISNINSFGIEVDAKNDKHVTPAQQEAVIRLLKLLNIKAQNIVGHGEIKSTKQAQAGQTILQKIRGGPDFSYGDDYKPNPQGTWMPPTEVTPKMQ